MLMQARGADATGMGRGAAAAPRARIGAIDALRGLVMLLMLVDHVREFFYLQAQVSDPMNLATTPPDLFLTRAASHLCAPVFLLLTGLSASLYGAKHGSRAATSAFLLKRGFFLILLEVTLVNLAWTLNPLPPILYLQVIWAIGISMLALSALLWPGWSPSRSRSCSGTTCSTGSCWRRMHRASRCGPSCTSAG